MAGRRRWGIAAAAAEEDEGNGECSYSLCYPGEDDGDDNEQTPRACGKGHRASLSLETAEGGSICLVCFSNLVSDPAAPSHHVSYALSQISRAIHGGGTFLRELRACHAHLLVLPLVKLLSSVDDEPLASQAIDLVSDLCFLGSDGAQPSASSGDSLTCDFIARIADRLGAGALAWSRRQLYTLHCFGVLLSSHRVGDPSQYIRDKAALVSNLVTGLQLPSEEVCGEILYVLYRLSILHDPAWGNDYEEEHVSSTGFRLLRLSLEVLLKTQNDDVRLNCIALLTVLIQRGYFRDDWVDDYCGETNNLLQTEATPDTPLVNLFTDAIKGSLLSSNMEVQIGALDLVFHSITMELSASGQIGILIEENIADYVFEILRLSGNKDSLVVPCLQVLELLATADKIFRQRLAVGFSTLLSVLHYVADIPLHPVQRQTMKLVWNCISNCPGIISISQVEELAMTLTVMFGRYGNGELGMLSETFVLACLTFVEVLKSPSSYQIRRLETLIRETSQNAILSSLSARRNTNQLLLHSLYLLKEAFLYSHQESSTLCCGSVELVNCIIEICATHLLPWLIAVLEDGEDEDAVLGVLEMFHLILLQESEARRKLAELLASSSWISWSFGCLGLFPSMKMKWRVYLLLSSVVDCLFGQECGDPIRNTYMILPSDPMELILLLGHRSTFEDDLIPSQSAVLLILYISSLFEERISDEHQVLASLEQYILVNGSNFSCGVADSIMLTQLVHLYGFIRGVLTAYRTPYSNEAEKILFRLICEHDWDLLCMSIHPIALRWLFQQDNIRSPLSNQIRNFCRSYGTNKFQVNKHAKIIQLVDIQMIAELVASGDNFLASLLVSLLKQLQEERQEADGILVMDVLLAILNISTDASKQFCLNNISVTFHILYSSYSSLKAFTICSLLVFNVLNSVHPEVLTEDGAWLPITVKLLEWLSPQLTEDACSLEAHLIIGILCLILHHSTSQALGEASKAILLNTCLVSAVDHKIQTACDKGPALVNYDEETSKGEELLLLLLLYFFSLRRWSVLPHLDQQGW